MNHFNENSLTEQSLIEWLQSQGYEYAYGPDIAPNQPSAEREFFNEVVLKSKAGVDSCKSIILTKL